MNRKDVNFHLFMIILSAMIECECPHMYGRKGGEMCPLAEQTTEVGAPGHLNFSCEALPDLTVGASVLSVIRSAKPRTECPLENHSSRGLTSGAFWCWGNQMTNLKKSDKSFFNLQIVLLIVLIIFVLVLYSWKKSSTASPSSNVIITTPVITPSLILEKMRVKYVIDGDTVILYDNSKVRYIGIDSPELDKNGKMECFAENAKNFNRQLVENQTVSLEK